MYITNAVEKGLLNMKFELNEYHRNVSNDELIADVIDTANRLGKSSLTADSYSKNGK